MIRLALWFFFISVFAHYSCVRTGGLHFDMTWFSFIFPNTALVTATLAVGKAFDVHAIQVVGTAMAVLLTCVWIFVMLMMGRSIWKKQLLWPQDEKEEEENPPPSPMGSSTQR